MSAFASNATYVTVAEAEAYFATRLNSDWWTECDLNEKERALITSTQRIDTLAFSGYRTVSTQELKFPRSGETTIPDGVKIACCELALALIQGWEPEAEIRNLTVNNEGVANSRTTYNRDFAQEHVANGFPNQLGWAHLKPYLVEAGGVKISRV